MSYHLMAQLLDLPLTPVISIISDSVAVSMEALLHTAFKNALGIYPAANHKLGTILLTRYALWKLPSDTLEFQTHSHSPVKSQIIEIIGIRIANTQLR